MYEVSEDSTILHEPQEHYAVILSSKYIYIFLKKKNIVITINTFNHIHGITMTILSGDIFYFAAVENNQNAFTRRKFGLCNLSSSNLTGASGFYSQTFTPVLAST